MHSTGNLMKLGFRHCINARYAEHMRIFKGFQTLSNMTRPKVYVTRQINEEALNILQKTCDVTTWSGPGPVPRAELLKKVPGVSGIFCLLTDKIDKEVLKQAGNALKVVATMSVGYDHLVIDDIKSFNVKIGYTPDILTDATAELTIALLLATSRRLLEANGEVKNGGWQVWSPFWMCGPSLSGSTIGIVGFGRIGQEVAKRLKPFNVNNILYVNRSEKMAQAMEIGATRVSFEELIQQSDFIILTCSLTPETQNLFNEATFKKMKPTSVLINTSRGGVVNQDDLVEALKNKTIWAAGLDVTTPEPLPLNSELLKLKNCVILPHIGSASIKTRKEMAILTANNIVAAIKGEKMPAELIL